MEDKKVLGRLPVVGSPVESVRTGIASNLMSKPFAAAVIDGIESNQLDMKAVNDILFDNVWKRTVKGKKLTEADRLFQRIYVESLMATAGFKNPNISEAPQAIAQTHCDLMAPDPALGGITYSEVSGFEWEPRSIGGGRITLSTVYAELHKVLRLLEKRAGKGPDGAHYSLLKSTIEYGVR